MLKFLAVVLFVNLLQTECLDEGDYCNSETLLICKLLSQCPTLVSEIKQAGRPMPIHVRRKLEALKCGFKGKEPMVCCSLTISSNIGETNFSTTSVDTADNVEAFTRRTSSDDDTGPEDVQNHPNLHLLPRECGSIENDKIWGGEVTNLFEMPWMVLLSYHSGRGPKFGCGGTLITERYVLTAAHCVSHSRGSLILDGVIIGEYDTETDPDCTTVVEKICAPKVMNVTIEEVTAHPGYTYETLADDIALIRLAQPADFSLDSVKPICLPVTRKLQTEKLVGRSGTVLGWGIYEQGVPSSVLRSVDLPILANADFFKGRPRITEKQIVASGSKNKDSCKGDSGGPLLYAGPVWSTEAHYVQRGIASFGSIRCGTDLPGVYTNVAYYMKWILDNIRS